MKEVEIRNVHEAAQLAVGLKEGQVLMAMEAPPPQEGPLHWLTYRCDPARAREIAQTLLDGADIAEGKMAPKPEYDDNAEAFHEHH